MFSNSSAIINSVSTSRAGDFNVLLPRLGTSALGLVAPEPALGLEPELGLEPPLEPVLELVVSFDLKAFKFKQLCKSVISPVILP